MPTYKFVCTECEQEWAKTQKVDQVHVDTCAGCGKVCENVAFGGSGFQFAGKSLNKQLTGFPDYAHDVNKQADKEGEEMEKMYDQNLKEKMREDDD